MFESIKFFVKKNWLLLSINLTLVIIGFAAGLHFRKPPCRSQMEPIPQASAADPGQNSKGVE